MEITNNIQLSATALNLRRLRIVNGYTYEELAEQTGIPAIDLIKFEMDKAKPSRKQIKLLAKFYGVDNKVIAP